jgi:hypothetical protein
MENDTTVNTLFAELGPLFDPAAILHDEETATWAVLLDEDTHIDISYDEESEQLVFALGLGPIPPEIADQIYELLLRFSFIWQENGGLHAGLDADGEAHLMFKYPLAGLDAQRLNNLLENLGQYCRIWADLIDRTEAGEIDPNEDLPPFPPDALRV